MSTDAPDTLSNILAGLGTITSEQLEAEITAAEKAKKEVELKIVRLKALRAFADNLTPKPVRKRRKDANTTRPPKAQKELLPADEKVAETAGVTA